MVVTLGLLMAPYHVDVVIAHIVLAVMSSIDQRVLAVGLVEHAYIDSVVMGGPTLEVLD